MQNTLLFTIQDKVAESYAPIFESPNLATALRNFVNTIRQLPDETINDLDLICVGKVVRDKNCHVDTKCPDVGLIDTTKHKDMVINTNQQEKNK